MGIECFAGVVIVNRKGDILLIKDRDDYAYAIPWCRVRPGKTIRECLAARVKNLTGLEIEPVFLEPSEYIEDTSHHISFDHVAVVGTDVHYFTRDNLDYLWINPAAYATIRLVPMTRKIIKSYIRRSGEETY